MQKLNKLCAFVLVIFSSCNSKNETGRGLMQGYNERSIFSDTIELIENQDTFKKCNELQGTWKMFKYIPTMNDKQQIDTNINLRINGCKLIKTKFGNVIDSTSLVKEFKNKRYVFYWQNVEDRYIRYVPDKDVVILNEKGFDGGIEYYERKN